MSNFNFSFQSEVSLEQMIGFEMAGRIWSQYIDDDAVFNVSVATTDLLPSSVVGGALPVYVSTDIATVQNALNQDATSSNDAIATSNLNTTTAPDGETQYRALLQGSQYQASDLTITRANAKALGIEGPATPNSVDGYVLFNTLEDSGFSWDYDFSRTSVASNQQLDFLGMALHELGHIMGFVSGIDSTVNATAQSNQQSAPQFSLFGLGNRLFGSGNRGDARNQVDLSQTSVFDLFRYSARSSTRNAQDLTQGEEAYFSIDGGQTSIAPLSTGLVESSDGVATGYQASHWGYKAPTSASPRGQLGLPSLFDIIANPFESIFNLAGAALSLQSSLLGGQFSRVSQNALQRPKSLGIMDPVLVPGRQSGISALDLQAFDVIGYDLAEASPLELNYNDLLSLAEQQVALSGNSEVFETFEAFDGEILERRRSRVRTRRAVFFQDVEGQPPVEQNLSSQRQAISSPGTGTVLNSATTSASSKLLDTATDESVSGQEIKIDDLLVDGSNRQRLEDTVQPFRDPASGRLASSNDDFASIESRQVKTTWQVLFGVSDSYVSGRNGTGSWLFNQRPSPLLLDLKGVGSLTSWR